MNAVVGIFVSILDIWRQQRGSCQQHNLPAAGAKSPTPDWHSNFVQLLPLLAELPAKACVQLTTRGCSWSLQPDINLHLGFSVDPPRFQPAKTPQTVHEPAEFTLPGARGTFFNRASEYWPCGQCTDSACCWPQSAWQGFGADRENWSSWWQHELCCLSPQA